SPEELGQILTVTSQRSPQLAAVFALCALTGARRGEALALRWSDYDREVKVLTIARSIGYTPNDGIYEKATKTHSVRRIGVDEILEGVIVSQIDALEKNTELGFYLVDDPFLFYGLPDGSKPLHPDTPSKYFRKMCNQLGLSYHLHQLRHFTATELIAAGVDIRTVSGRLGHADASVTLRVYSHVLEAQDRAASEYIGSRVFIPKPIDRT
ncbi:MAG: site-specific integrase, partial [Actinomycetota bacterium]|nr:site-specific integrase [Actinomycetota bacterium]